MSGQNKTENISFYTFILLIVVLLMVGWFFWFLFGAQITEGLRWIRIGELWGVEKVTGNQQVKVLRDAAIQAPRLTFQQVLVLSRVAMNYFKWPLALILTGASYWVYRDSPKRKYKQRHNLESFIKTQAKAWPVITPIINFNPSKEGRVPGKVVPSVLPPFAEALSPEEWVAFNRIPVINGAPERESLRRAFLSQLGPRWKGPGALPPYGRALFAAFALKYLRMRKESDDLLGEIAQAWTLEGGLALPGGLIQKINKIIADPAIGGQAAKVAAFHAYATTALLGLLKRAREQGGVLAPASFLWLRAVDRALWYPLNNLGRQSYHTEAAGAMAHFMSELNAQRPLVVPRVEAAIDTISTYFSEARPTVPPVQDALAKKK